MKKLNKKQERFCTFYSQTLNGQKSAELAGYAKGSARITASKLLTQANIKAKIAELLGNARAQAELSLVDILNNLKAIVTATMADFATWEAQKVSLKESAELSRELQGCIEQVAETSSKTGEPQLRIKLYSKLQAAGLILRIFELSELEARLAKLEEKIGE